MTEITIHPSGETFDCAPGDTILRAALRAGVGMAYSCNVGSCGNCRFELIEGEVHHQYADPPAWSERDLKRNRWLGCQAEPAGPCRIKFRADPANVAPQPPARRAGTLESVTPITRDISEFAIRIEGDDGFQPGQYALIRVPGIEGGRAYSMCNLPGEGIWRFQIKRTPDGAVSGHLFDKAAPGDRLDLDGPFGTAYLRPEIPRDIVLLAGGSGLSPMVSIARAAQAQGLLKDRKLHFFYGCRTPDDLFDLSIFDDGLREAMEFTAAVSDTISAAHWDGATGFLHDVVLAHYGEDLKECEIYFAGPAVMSGAIQKAAHEAGVPMDQLHFDEFY